MMDWRNIRDLEEAELLQPMVETGTASKTRSRARPEHPNDLPMSLVPNLDELESEHVLGDMELLLLLRRHCVDGAFENFIYLFERKILKNDKKSFRIIESRDNNGCTLLHYAAKGGSKDILETLLKHCHECTIDDTDHFGHTLLHFACKYGQYDLCAYILSADNYCKRLLTKTSHDGWNAAHFTAVSGNVRLFQLIHGKRGIDMQSDTKNGLNILHIACIYNNTSFCQALFNMNNELKLPLGKADLRGWNIAHFAAKVGNKDAFNYVINEEFASQKTLHGKTVLHICCEYGHYELCELILKDSPFIGAVLHDVDDEGWNAFHHAAKGGNLKVFKMIEEALKSSDPLDVLLQETFYFETVLHICCIHKNVEICRYICSKLKSAPEMVNKPSTNLWTAAHYVAVEIKQDGSEEELIRILVRAGIDLKSQSNHGKTVLTVAFEHRNDNLIDYLLTHHIELVKINTPKLREAAAHSKIYEEKLQKALQKVKC
uniref:Serine/threonine-protein phosphatase 6 regulatory ankyrin repeat subunit C-like isoform X2 n=1 Tax=Crassostrea virginica TaxID=6565 RepID=A0A8B8B8E0_CRAVI|nr:serine/threonine-protein phosphatase 6 regulatory ankyrin repeat subunit C-like isoform X2 [Crassostrea virginica]